MTKTLRMDNKKEEPNQAKQQSPSKETIADRESVIAMDRDA